jgi:hypothetical protein
MMAVSALNAPAPLHRAALTSGFDAFQDCFARVQDQSGRPWAFVPSTSGGMFTNIGVAGSGPAYRLIVRNGASGASVRLIADNPDAALLAAVEQCR